MKSDDKFVSEVAKAFNGKIQLLVFEAGIGAPMCKFWVSKVQLDEGLKFVAEGRDAEQRQARLRHIISNLIATSHK